MAHYHGVGVPFISVASTLATTCLILSLFSLNSFSRRRIGAECFGKFCCSVVMWQQMYLLLGQAGSKGTFEVVGFRIYGKITVPGGINSSDQLMRNAVPCPSRCVLCF